MNNRLRKREKCPVHPKNPYFCECHGPKKQKFRRQTEIKGPVTRINMPEHPRGYIEVCSESELRRRKHEKIREQKSLCACGCQQEFTDYRDAELDHIDAKKMGGGFRDEHRDNLRVLKRACHQVKTGALQWSKPA
jgi:hypothetical protein